MLKTKGTGMNDCVLSAERISNVKYSLEEGANERTQGEWIYELAC